MVPRLAIQISVFNNTRYPMRRVYDRFHALKSIKLGISDLQQCFSGGASVAYY